MRLSIPRPIRRWRWEWLAVLLSILLYGSCGLSIYGCPRELLAPIMPLEESIERFDNAIPGLEKVLQSYDATYHEAKPENDFLYTRGIEAKASNVNITASLVRSEKGEIYKLRVRTNPALTPEQSLPDEQLVKSLCEWQGTLLEKGAKASLIEKTPAMLADARRYLSASQSEQRHDRDIDDPFVYGKQVLLRGHIWGDDVAYLGIDRIYYNKLFYTELIISCRRSR